MKKKETNSYKYSWHGVITKKVKDFIIRSTPGRWAKRNFLSGEIFFLRQVSARAAKTSPYIRAIQERRNGYRLVAKGDNKKIRDLIYSDYVKHTGKQRRWNEGWEHYFKTNWYEYYNAYKRGIYADGSKDSLVRKLENVMGVGTPVPEEDNLPLKSNSGVKEPVSNQKLSMLKRDYTNKRNELRISFNKPNERRRLEKELDNIANKYERAGGSVKNLLKGE